jgi:hypothetical protein
MTEVQSLPHVEEVTLGLQTAPAGISWTSTRTSTGHQGARPLAAEFVDYPRVHSAAERFRTHALRPIDGRVVRRHPQAMDRLLEIAGRMLGSDFKGKKGEFFNFRHTGASHIAQRGETLPHLLAVVKMMGDTSVETVNNIELDLSRAPGAPVARRMDANL